MLGDTPVPQHKPIAPEGAIAESMAVLSGVTDAVFMPWIEERINLIWLEPNDDRLGMTRFEEGSAELNQAPSTKVRPR